MRCFIIWSKMNVYMMLNKKITRTHVHKFCPSCVLQHVMHICTYTQVKCRQEHMHLCTHRQAFTHPNLIYLAAHSHELAIEEKHLLTLLQIAVRRFLLTFFNFPYISLQQTEYFLDKHFLIYRGKNIASGNEITDLLTFTYSRPLTFSLNAR